MEHTLKIQILIKTKNEKTTADNVIVTVNKTRKMQRETCGNTQTIIQGIESLQTNRASFTRTYMSSGVDLGSGNVNLTWNKKPIDPLKVVNTMNSNHFIHHTIN